MPRAAPGAAPAPRGARRSAACAGTATETAIARRRASGQVRGGDAARASISSRCSSPAWGRRWRSSSTPGLLAWATGSGRPGARCAGSSRASRRRRACPRGPPAARRGGLPDRFMRTVPRRKNQLLHDRACAEVLRRHAREPGRPRSSAPQPQRRSSGRLSPRTRRLPSSTCASSSPQCWIHTPSTPPPVWVHGAAQLVGTAIVMVVVISGSLRRRGDAVRSRSSTGLSWHCRTHSDIELLRYSRTGVESSRQ
jgi:hypothetical protein